MANRDTKTQSHPERSEVPHQISHCPFGAGKIPTEKYLIINYELFMQNKPNLLDAQINVTSVTIRDYEEKQPSRHSKNKPKSNPIGWMPKMNVTSVLIKYYENLRLCRCHRRNNEVKKVRKIKAILGRLFRSRGLLCRFYRLFRRTWLIFSRLSSRNPARLSAQILYPC